MRLIKEMLKLVEANNKEHDFDKKFPDTEQGVIDMLTTNMVKSLIKTIDFSTCKFTPDPTVDGV
jgi:hypothetical protein